MGKDRDLLLSVPVLDIGALIACTSAEEVQSSADNGSLQKTIDDLRAAAAEWGFFYISNHGVTSEEIERLRDTMRAFFALPKELKKTINRNTNNQRGYFDFELTKNKLDWKEGFDIGGRFEDGPADPTVYKRMGNDQNQWLPDEVLPGFRAEMQNYFDRMTGISKRLVMLFSLVLGKEATFLDQFFRTEKQEDSHSGFFRLNHYPVAPDPTSTMGLHHHTDAGGVTILLQDDDVTSLQVFHRGTQEWIHIPPLKDTFVINIGDMLQIWSNDRFVAPLHRVLANGSAERYSAPFFYNPSYEAIVQPVAATDPDEKPLYNPVNWYDFRFKRFQGDLADLGEEVQIVHYRVQ